MWRIKTVFIVLWVIILSGCSKVEEVEIQSSAVQVNTEYGSVEEQTIQNVETESVKPVSEYKDCRAVINPEYVLELAEDGVIVPKVKGTSLAPIIEWEPPANVMEMSVVSSHVVVGEVIDLTYSDSVITESGNKATTIYSFAVSEVLKGEEIDAETIITVVEFQGYIRRSVKRYSHDSDAVYAVSDGKVYYIETFADEPLIEVGDKYVLFIEPYECDYLDGKAYRNNLMFMGKYTCDEDGLYQKYIWDWDFEWIQAYFYDIDPVTGEKTLLEPPLTLDEIRERIR